MKRILSHQYIQIMIVVILFGRMLRDTHLELPLKNIVNRLDDLKLASHKVDEVNRLIFEQEWKIKHFTSYSHLSFLSYISVITATFVLIVCCYCCCCKCCERKILSF